MRCGPTLVIACGLLACAARPFASGQPSVEPPASPSVTAAARPSIVADRGVAVGTQGVWVIAAWRADVDARGVLVVLPRPGASAAELAALANRSLDVGFNHAHVEAPAGVPVDDATWAEVSRFLDEVAAERLTARAMTPDPPENGH